MKEVPNRIMFSEIKEIHVSAYSFIKSDSSYLTLVKFDLQLDVYEKVMILNILRILKYIFVRI